MIVIISLVFTQGESGESPPNSATRRDSTALQTTNLIAATHRDFFSNISSDLNGLATSTSNMFSDFFGSKGKQNLKLSH